MSNDTIPQVQITGTVNAPTKKVKKMQQEQGVTTFDNSTTKHCNLDQFVRSSSSSTTTEFDSNKGLLYDEFKKEYMDGSTVYKRIKGASDPRYYHRIDSALKEVGANNVVEFLDDYYKKSGYQAEELQDGLLERLDEEYDKGEIDIEGKLNVVNALLEKAKELGLDGCEEYREIDDIRSFYNKDEAYENRQNLRGRSLKGSKWRNFGIGAADTACGTVAGAIVGAAVGAVLGGIFGFGAGAAPMALAGAKLGAWIGSIGTCGYHHVSRISRFGHAGRHTDSELLDSAMYELHKKVKAEMEKQAQAAQ